MDWEYIIYYPYIYSMFLFFIDSTKEPDKVETLMICSAVAFAATVIVSFWDISRLKERG